VGKRCDCNWYRNNRRNNDRKTSNDDWNWKWVSHLEIETARRAQNAHIVVQRRATEGLVRINTERTGMEPIEKKVGRTNPLIVVVNLDFGFQLLTWTPEMTKEELVGWFSGLSEADMKNFWDDPRALPGRVEQIALARSLAPTHVLNIEGKKHMSLVEVHEGSPVGGTLMIRDLYDD